MQYATPRFTAQSKTKHKTPLPPPTSLDLLFRNLLSSRTANTTQLLMKPTNITTNAAGSYVFQDNHRYFNIGILTPFSLAIFCASSYPASACLTMAVPGSVVKTVTMRLSASFVPSATKHMPAWIL